MNYGFVITVNNVRKTRKSRIWQLECLIAVCWTLRCYMLHKNKLFSMLILVSYYVCVCDEQVSEAVL